MPLKPPSLPVAVRQTRPDDFDEIGAISQHVYPTDRPWMPTHLALHVQNFPQGQFVAVDPETDDVLGMAASLIVQWDDYDMQVTWAKITGNGTFNTHNPAGRTLYGAEVMVDPEAQGRGVGKALYAARRELCQSLRLLRIRAGARLRGYHRYASAMSAEQYVMKVVQGELSDPTLSFQLKQGFHVLSVVPGYLSDDPASLGYAAVIEWLNHNVARRRHYAHRDPRFIHRRTSSGPKSVEQG